MLSDKELSTEILTIEKNLSELYFTAAEESRTEPLHCDLKTMMNDALKNQLNTFNILLESGYYKIEEVNNTQIDKVKNKYNMSAN